MSAVVTVKRIAAQVTHSPEQIVTGPLFDRLVDELAAANIRFDVTVEKVRTMGIGGGERLG